MSTRRHRPQADTNVFQMLPDHIAMEMLLKESISKMRKVPTRSSSRVKDEQHKHLQRLRSKLKEIRQTEISSYKNLKREVCERVTRTAEQAKCIKTAFMRTIEDELQSSLSQMDKMDKYLEHIGSELSFMSNHATDKQEQQIADMLRLNESYISEIDAQLTDLLSSLKDHVNTVAQEFFTRPTCQISTLCDNFLDEPHYSGSDAKQSETLNLGSSDMVHVTNEENSPPCHNIQIEDDTSDYATLDHIDYLRRQSLDTSFDSFEFDCFSIDLQADIQDILSKNPADVNLAFCEGTFVWKVDNDKLPILQNPTDLVFLPNGNLVVTDPSACFIYQLDPFGNVVSTHSNVSPFGVTLTQDNFLVITDTKERNLKAFTRGGDLVCSFAKGYFSNPTHICSKNEHKYIVMDKKNSWNQQVYIYNMMQGSKLQLGQKTEDSLPFQRLHNPAFITLDHLDNIYISDQGSHAIKVFQLSTGAYVRHFGQQGDVGSDLSYPMGLTTDVHGHLLVADSGNHRLSVFTSDGRFARNLLTHYDGIEYPQAIALSNRGQLAVIQRNSVYMYILH